MLDFLKGWDAWGFRLINQGCANPLGDVVFPCLNHGAPFFLLLFLGLGWLAWRNERRWWWAAGLVVLAIVVGDAGIFNPLKHWLARPRPAATLENVRALASGAGGGFSFPSSHTANAFLAAAILMSFFRCNWPLWVAAAVGFSRIYVGVHYPGDVLGSAALGWGLGWLAMKGLDRWGALKKMTAPDETQETGSAGFSAADGKAVWPVLGLVTIQSLRLVWAAGTPLDVPPMAARWWLSLSWGDVFCGWGLWLIPWIMQTLWLALLALWVWRRKKTAGLWGVVLVAAAVPWVSQLSFLGAPEEILADADWGVTLPWQAAALYLLWGLPLWCFIAASVFGVSKKAAEPSRLRFSEQRRDAAATLLFGRPEVWAGVGLVLGVCFPGLPWWVPAVLSLGVAAKMAMEFAEYRERWGRPEARWARLFLVWMVIYGAVAGAAVYQTRFLRKLNLSLLPRNSPHYVQTGWREWAERIRPVLMERPGAREIWVDSDLSRVELQYYLGSRWRVRLLDEALDGLKSRPLPPGGFFYVREEYLTQINPRVLFQGRRDHWESPEIPLRKGWNEVSQLTVFRKGDPIRQFQFYFIQ
ncbi:MAG: phosphatase PAP2 family protein [Verrucomicrobiae bacterium]|nr:phosphatase PAP2 family protein [Verrucomicrobiae bacterium]